jgi:hypothetical protein
MRGGARKGAGRKPGVSYKKPHEKREQIAITMPASIKARLKANHSNLSKYILKLIKSDYEQKGLEL